MVTEREEEERVAREKREREEAAYEEKARKLAEIEEKKRQREQEIEEKLRLKEETRKDRTAYVIWKRICIRKIFVVALETCFQINTSFGMSSHSYITCN